MSVDAKSPKELFLAALAVPAEKRSEWLIDACAGDEDLLRRVKLLLAAHDAPESLVDRLLPPVDASEQTTQARANASPDLEAPLAPEEQATQCHHPEQNGDPLLGTLFADRYKIREKLGQGGMGTVYVADQIKPVQRRVALKLIRGDFASSSTLARFEQERQALALMDHPNIAKVLDAGIATFPSRFEGEGRVRGGTPYFVMELIKGVPITQYCDEAKLTPKERLALFTQVCQAVQHAHQKGIIHRDLKPSNILIGLYDGKPVPKIIDFGVAKATGPRISEKSVYTEMGSLVGTLEYMSPEQAELNNLDIDTRTDIYALGIVLYELLTGMVPFSQKEFAQAGLVQMLVMIKEVEPPKPSTKLSGSGSLPSIAATRKMEPAKLAKLMRGELDWIVMKCLEKERSRRYETANGLAQDLERYLQDAPVEACPPSRWYRLRKFARRNRKTVITTVAVIAGSLLAAAGQTWNLLQARAAEARAQQEERKAFKSAAEARAIIEFFKHVTLEARLNVKEGNKWRPKTVDEATAVIDSESVRRLFADHPLAEADVREWLATAAEPTIGGNLFGISFAQRPVGQGVKKGLYTKSSPVGDENPLFPVPITMLYDPERDQHNLERALDLRSLHLGPNDPKTLATMHLLGKTVMQIDPEKAIQVPSELVSRSNAALTMQDKQDLTLQYEGSLAEAYEHAKKLDNAILLWKDIYILSKNLLGPDHINTTWRSDSLAAAYEKAGRIEEASRQREESLRGRRKKAAGSADFNVGVTLFEVARLYERLGDYARAEPLWREALPNLTTSKNTLIEAQVELAKCLLKMGKPTDAESVLRECLTIRGKTDPSDWTMCYIKSLLGASLLGQKKYTDAEPLLLTGYEGLKKATGVDAENHARMIENLEWLVQLSEAAGQKEKVDEWRRKLQEAKNAAGAPVMP